MIRGNESALGSAPPEVVEPAKKSLLTPRNIIILVGVVAWIAVLLLFVLPAVTRKPAAATASGEAVAKPAIAAEAAAAHEAAPATGGVGAAPKAVPSPQLSIPNRVFNLAGTSAGFKYVKLSIVVQFADEGGKFAKAKGEAGKKLQDEFALENSGTLGAFNDILTTTVSSKTAVELATPQGKETLRQELTSKFNRALAGGKEHVTYVIFSDFVMQ